MGKGKLNIIKWLVGRFKKKKPKSRRPARRRKTISREEKKLVKVILKGAAARRRARERRERLKKQMAAKIARARRAARKHREMRKKILIKHRVRVKRAKRKHPKTKDYKESGFVFKTVDGKVFLLETDVDRVLDAITKKDRIKASKLARTFKVPRSKIEEWGIILEDHKLIDMHYPPFGEPILMVKKLKKVKKGKK